MAAYTRTLVGFVYIELKHNFNQGWLMTPYGWPCLGFTFDCFWLTGSEFTSVEIPTRCVCVWKKTRWSLRWDIVHVFFTRFHLRRYMRCFSSTVVCLTPVDVRDRTKARRFDSRRASFASVTVVSWSQTFPLVSFRQQSPSPVILNVDKRLSLKLWVIHETKALYSL